MVVPMLTQLADRPRVRDGAAVEFVRLFCGWGVSPAGSRGGIVVLGGGAAERAAIEGVGIGSGERLWPFLGRGQEKLLCRWRSVMCEA